MSPVRLFALFAALLAVPLASGDDEYDCRTSQPDLDVAGEYYVAHDDFNNIHYVRVYEESNEIPGLQRRDEVADDTFGGLCYPADTRIYPR